LASRWDPKSCDSELVERHCGDGGAATAETSGPAGRTTTIGLEASTRLFPAASPPSIASADDYGDANVVIVTTALIIPLYTLGALAGQKLPRSKTAPPPPSTGSA
jgi:hypothetical protein